MPIKFSAREGPVMDKSIGMPDPVFAPEPDTQLIKRLEAVLESAHPKLVAKAHAIVTDNLKHFPAVSLDHIQYARQKLLLEL